MKEININEEICKHAVRNWQANSNFARGTQATTSNEPRSSERVSERGKGVTPHTPPVGLLAFPSREKLSPKQITWSPNDHCAQGGLSANPHHGRPCCSPWVATPTLQTPPPQRRSFVRSQKLSPNIRDGCTPKKMEYKSSVCAPKSPSTSTALTCNSWSLEGGVLSEPQGGKLFSVTEEGFSSKSNESHPAARGTHCTVCFPHILNFFVFLILAKLDFLSDF